MLHLPCYICIGILGLLLVVQTIQNHRITLALHSRILESKGMDGIPEEHPLADMLGKLKVEPQTNEQKRLMKTAQERIHFKIPGMPEFKGR